MILAALVFLLGNSAQMLSVMQGCMWNFWLSLLIGKLQQLVYVQSWELKMVEQQHVFCYICLVSAAEQDHTSKASCQLKHVSVASAWAHPAEHTVQHDSCRYFLFLTDSYE